MEMNVNEKTSGLSRYSLLPLEAGASYHVLIFHEEFGKLYSFLLRTLSSSLNCYSQPWSLFFVFYLSCRLIFQEDMILIYSQDLWFNQEKKKKEVREHHWLAHVFPLHSWLGLPLWPLIIPFSHMALSLTLRDENVICYSEVSAKITLQSAN